MGTRSLTVFVDRTNEEKEGREICVLYRQYDGYVEGHGYELADFLNGFEITNGLRLPYDSTRKIANGMACLTAQAIAHFKKEPGEFYLYPAGSREMWEEYIYYVTVTSDGLLNIAVKRYDETIFSGSAAELRKFQES